MASCEASETSFFSLSGVRERMREKKKGALRTAKLNASLASKIKTKIINNSSTIKVSLKHNNKALALALNAEKANAQRLTQDKAILQKEMEQCHFQNAVLRHRLSVLENALNEVENIAAAVRTARLSEFCMSSVSSSNGQKGSMTEDSLDNYIADGQLVRAAGMPMRVPISKLCDSGQQGGHSIVVQTSSQHLHRPASNESPETMPVASKDTLPPQPAEKPQSHQEENGKKPTEAMETQEILHESHIFGEALCATQQKPNNFPEHAWGSHSFSYEGDEMTKEFSDRLSQRHITQRRRRSTLFATSTPSSGVDISSHVNSTQAAQWSITRDRSSSSMSNTEPQLTSRSNLVSLTETAVISHRKSLGKEIFCDQPQAKETECSAETDPSYSQVPQFVHVKAESKGKTVEKTSVKKAMREKKRTNAVKANAESTSDILQIEETAQNAKQFLQPKIPTCCSESEVYEMRKKVCVGTSNRSNTGFEVEQHSCSPDKLRDLRRTYVVNPAQLHSLGSDDLLEQGKKEVIFKTQSMESLSKSPVCTSHEVPSDDSSVQNLLQLKETSTACALPEDSSMSKKSIRQKTKRKTRVIRQRDCSDEENLLNTVKIPGAKAEEQPEISQTSRKKAALITTTAFPDKEVGFGPCIGVGGVAKESTKDSSGNLKCSRKTYTIHPFDFAGNLGCAQTEFEGGEILPLRSVSGRKASKIPRVHRMVGAHRSKEQRGVLEAEGQAEVTKTMSGSEKRAYPQLKSQRKRNISRPPEPDSLARQSDGTKAVTGSSAECASKQTSLRGEFSCVTDLLSMPDTFLKEQIDEISLTNNLMDLSHSLESSPVTCPATSPVNSSLTDVPVSKSLRAGGNRSPVSDMPEKSSVWLGSSLTFKEKTAEELPGKRNQVESSSQSSPPQEPEKMPLQNLTNTRTLSSSSEVSRRSARKRQDPGCYKEPKLNSKLRRGDPFTNTAFLFSPIYKKQKTAKAKETTTTMKQNGSLEECPGVNTSMLIVTVRDMEPEVK